MCGGVSVLEEGAEFPQGGDSWEGQWVGRCAGVHTPEGASHLSSEARGTPHLLPCAGHSAASPGLCWNPFPEEEGHFLLTSAGSELSVTG